jgi:hypothetical protein
MVVALLMISCQVSEKCTAKKFRWTVCLRSLLTLVSTAVHLVS